MDKLINDFYSKVDINSSDIDRIIAKAKAMKPRKTTNKIVLFSSACAAALIIGIFSAVIINISNTSLSSAQNYSFENISNFNISAISDQVLIEHNGFCIWISGAYFNGEKLYLAITGEKVKDNQHLYSKADKLKYIIKAQDDFELNVNNQKISLKNDEIILNKDGKYFTGLIEANTHFSDSIVIVKMTIPYFEVYEDDALITKAYGPFDFNEVVSHTYTKNEERLINTGDELHISSVFSVKREFNETGVGVYMNYFIPDTLYNSQGEINAALYNEDGSEIPLIQEFETRKDAGHQKSLGFGEPIGRNIKVVLKSNNQTLQEYDVYLNDSDVDYVIDE